MTHPHGWPAEPECEKIHGLGLVVIWTLCAAGAWMLAAVFTRAVAHLADVVGKAVL